MERRKESVSSSPLTKQPIVPSEMAPTDASSKTADKPRKGLPSFVWVIGMCKKQTNETFTSLIILQEP